MIIRSCQQFVFTITDLHLAQCLFAQQKNTCGKKSAIIVTITFSWITFNTRWWESGVASQREREGEKLATYNSCITQPNHVINHQTPAQLQHNFAKDIFSSSSSSLPWVLELAEALQHARPRCFAGSKRDAKLTTLRVRRKGTGGDCPQSGTRTCNLSIPDPQSSE